MKQTNALPAIGLGTGLWISPAGHVIALPGSHIEEIIAWPDRFGLTPARIESIYRHFGEPMPVEGRARHHIIRAVVFTGWIRLRQQRNYWSVTVDSLDTRRRPLQSFFHALHQADGIGKHAEIRIYCVQFEQLVTTDLHEFIDGFDPADGPTLQAGHTSKADALPPDLAPIDAELARQERINSPTQPT